MKSIILIVTLACTIKISYEFPFDVNKRNLAALAKNGQLPNQNGEEKRIKEENRDVYITQQDQNVKGIKGQFGFIQKRQSIEEPEIRDEFKSDLRTILDEYLEKFGTTYDPEKVELFLTNMADEVFDNQGVVSLDHIRYLIETGYFQPEMREEDDIKPIDSDSSDYISKRFLASLARTNNMPSWFDDQSTVNKRYISSLLRQGKLPFVFQPTTASPRGDQWIQNMQKPKRSNSESFQSAEEFVPVMQGSKTLQTLIDDFLMREQNMQKRYLAGTSRILGGQMRKQGSTRHQQQQRRKPTG
ncbi:uncharacterized protein LOC126893975 isoform X3 [Daktulosphaira vitifoliae]|uniref:uncharacterized protein LOC126893975 isoform X3 n=1 Tax=Daktulosphaira vitifoliae TaxID=58002 RepID=UPI0021A9CCB8|nr:uncharacterized protein LOC126893975 isoform X3 [Daktulosphaira vitifoliae]